MITYAAHPTTPRLLNINSGDENEEITALRAVKILTKKCNSLSEIMNPDYSNLDSAEVLTAIA
ncbi:hypothetical protein DAPPUDRAFT_237860 [Daphnia pulex]|uniref:Uncharacterized protein n=1 Tax=Daphnia pulex TaxID=6669 RepID=E9G4L2_DAPPU|nr:hypothetical protein DAPPUDRAFT_237860 [Daphnia pulex]|eukprot:EFX85535.1 hypothetical protein DAPPUDRAFT_237860 [Daphnia pulex]